MCALCINAMLGKPQMSAPEFTDAVGRTYEAAAEAFRYAWRDEFSDALFADSADDNEDEEDGQEVWRDGRCFPWLVYERLFVHAVAGAAIEAGIYANAKEFWIYMSLADRYIKRGEFLCSLLDAIFCPTFPLPMPEPEHVDEWFLRLNGLSKRQLRALKESDVETPLLMSLAEVPSVAASEKSPRKAKPTKQQAPETAVQMALFPPPAP